jgi:CSLREA domain-containing protein
VVPHQIRPRATGFSAIFTVNTTTDSPLLNPSGTTCVDDEGTPHCSLRAAVEAANNLGRAVEIKLAAHTYYLETDGSLTIENPGGTTIVGVGSTTHITSDLGEGYSVFFEHSSNVTSFTLENLQVNGGYGTDGGGIYVMGSMNSVVLSSVDLNDNTATELGGGIYCYGASVWASNSQLNSDYAGVGATSEGGGAFYDYWCSMEFVDTSLNSDHAGSTSYDGYGGGGYNEYGNATFIGGSVNSDVAGTSSTSGDGGAFYNEYGALTFTGTQVNHDTAWGDGGAIYSDYAGITATSTQFENDAADSSDGMGGAFYDEGGDSTLTNDIFSHDTTSGSSYGGGALGLYGYNYGVLVNGTGDQFLDNNNSAILGYGYYGTVQINLSNSTFTGNHSSYEYYGGAISGDMDEYGAVDVLLTSDKFTNNTASGGYGGGAIGLFSDAYGGADLTTNSSTFTGNVGSGEYSSGAIGEYVYYWGGGNVYVAGSKFTSNRAPYFGYGGAIGVESDDDYGPGSLNLMHDSFTANSAGTTADYGYGGAILTTEYTPLTATDSTFTNNIANGNSSDGGDGGAIMADSLDGATLSGDTLSGNSAKGAGYGGGIYTNGEYNPTVIESSTISDNHAVYGGGIYNYYYATSIIDSTISGNTAGGGGYVGYGGGIYAAETAFNLTNSTVSGNFAEDSGYGGGLYLVNQAYDSADPTGASIYFTTIDANAATHGGGTYLATSGTGLRDSIIAGNTTTPSSHTTSNCANNGWAFTSSGGNVLGTANCVHTLNSDDDVSGTTKVAQPLAANGGPTKTMALKVGSPAVHLVIGACLPSDQRGMARKVGHCDSGAYQLIVNGKAV